jgi:simple sugar transport system ATP-binding protein
MTDPAALELTRISKSFGALQALRGVDFSLLPGEVHALLGENGAGKSTLMHIADGMLQPDTGAVRVGGRTVALHSPRDARALGIGMVHQHFTSIAALTVGENLRLAVGRGSRAGAPGPGVVADSALSPLDAALPGLLREGLSPDTPVEDLSVALRQRLEIAKALATGARILLLDEPTALLAPSEVEELLRLVRAFVAGGGAVALITHKLPEVFAAADRVTVLRRGEVRLRGAVRGETEASLAEAMIGGAVPGSTARPPNPLASPRRSGLAEGPPAVRIGDIAVHAGELIGVAAVEGNGQHELLRAIAGLAPAAPVAVEVAGTVALVPEDRTIEGVIHELSVTENLVLGSDRDARWARGIVLDWAEARANAEELIRSFGIQAEGPDAPVATLSGGNQQKVVLARVLARRPAVLVTENPTRGLDIQATAEVHERLRAAAREGVAVLVYSTDLDEVLELGERVLVVHRGRVSEAPPGADRRVVGGMMLGLGPA